MDQNHCKLPHLGTQDTFSSTVKQHLHGVLRHGKGATLYRSFNHVGKGANLTVYTILCELEEWKKEHNGRYPEITYIQIVFKRVSRKIVLTRLPTGHTHEDIDAVFGCIWRWLRAQCIITALNIGHSLSPATMNAAFSLFDKQ